MKHSIAVKFIAIVLCALSVVAIAAGGVGVAFMQSYNLYNEPLATVKQQQLDSTANAIARSVAEWYAADDLGNCPSEVLNQIMSPYYLNGSMSAYYDAKVYEDSQLVYETGYEGSYEYTYETTVAPYFPIVSYEYTIDGGDEDDEPMTTVPVQYSVTEAPAETEPTAAADVPAEASLMDDGLAVPAEDAAAWKTARDEALANVAGQDIVFSSTHSDSFWDENGNYYDIIYNLDYYQAPEYKVVIAMDASAILGADFTLLSVLYDYREEFIPGILIGLLVFAVTLVYLCAAAGKTSSGEIHPNGLNRLPLDLYAVAAVGGIVLLLLPICWLIDSASYYDLLNNTQLVALILGLCVFGMALLGIGLIYAFAAQLKMKDGYWWHHSIVGFLLSYIARGLRWISRGFHYAGKGLCAVFRLLPVIWQWLLVAFLMVLSVGISFFGVVVSWDFWNFFWSILLVLSIAGCIAVVCYGGYCFGTLMKGAKAMAHGNLNHQIPTKYMLGAFKDFAIQLNSLAGAAQIAAEKQMKSERMKTELITNVSHDIKTPLTSIINYVDLLKKPHTDSDGVLYLEVLDRQSQRLKKLIDDLMEMSKASTGNLAVELGRVDAVEAINQALGEFGDKLASVNLTPVFRYPEFPVTMMADGRLVWRVLSNLLSNAVKYALPDTRLYIDLMCLQGNAVIAIKNISRDQLNVNVDELMERFVRGDSSRNTEGSGLGLNIAKSLVELQHGQMHLMVDGDLFKVTLIFPLA